MGQQLALYEQMREDVLRQTGYDIAEERKPPGWIPKALSPMPPATAAAAIARIAEKRALPVQEQDFPSMPLSSDADADLSHRETITNVPVWPAAVARLVPIKDRASNPKAAKACQEEWDKLLAAGTN